MKKKVIALILSMIMLISLVPTSAFAVDRDIEGELSIEDVNVDELEEEIDIDNIEDITGDKDYSLEDLEKDNKDEEDLDLKEDEKNASLKKANIKTYKGFKYEVINNKITIVDYIGKVKKLTIPSKINGIKVTTIGEVAFLDCYSLTGVTIPNSVRTIGVCAFYSCESLTSVTIPNSVTTMGMFIFGGCEALTEIKVDSKNTKYKSVNGVLFNKSGTLLIKYPSGKKGEYIIPTGVMTIGGYAFCACDSLTRVTIGNSVKTIGDYAFYDCDSLTSVKIGNSVRTIGDHAFWGCDSLTSVTIPNSVTTIGDHAFEYCYSLASVTIGNNVTTIGDWVFLRCTSLKSVTIPNSVTTMGVGTFKYCYSLTSVTIGNSVTTIGGNAFYCCHKLKRVIIPDSVTTIGVGAFIDCDSLTSVTIPNSVTIIKDRAFDDCPLLIAYVIKGSYAEEYCEKYGIKYKICNSTGKVDNSFSSGGGGKRIQVGDISTGREKTDGIKQNIGGKQISLFSFDVSGKVKLGDYVSAKYDLSKKTVKVLIGFKKYGSSSTINNSDRADSDFFNDYIAVKELYKSATGKNPGKSFYNKYGNLRSKLASKKMSLGLDAKGSLAGYLEYDYSKKTPVLKEGGIVLEATFGGSVSGRVPAFPAAYWTFGASSSAKGSISWQKKGNFSVAPSFNETSISLSANGGVGMGLAKSRFSTYIEGGLKGTMNNKIKGNFSSLKNSFSSSISGSLYVKSAVLGADVINTDVELAKVQIYPRKSTKSMSNLSKENGYDTDIAFNKNTRKTVDRSYIDETSKSFVQIKNKRNAKKTSRSVTDLYSLDNIYPYNNPSVVDIDDTRKMFVYVGDDKSKSDKNRTVLMYSIYDGMSWSEPEMIDRNEGTNDYPFVTSKNGKVYIIWQKSNKAFNTTDTLNTMMENTDLVYTVYDNGSFSKVKNVTENNTNFEMNQKMAIDENGNIAVAYVINSQNDPLLAEGTTKIILKELKNDAWTEKEIYSNANSITNIDLTYIDDTPVITYDKVIGEDLENNEISKLFIYKNNNTTSLNGTSGYFKYGYMYYVNNESVLCMYNIKDNAIRSLGVDTNGNYKLINKGLNTYLFNLIQTGYTNELTVNIYNNALKEWSEPIQLTNYNKYIRDFDVALDKDNNLMGVINVVDVNEENETNVYGNASLKVVNLENTYSDIEVDEYIGYDDSLVKPGATIPLNIGIKNVGIEDINQVNVQLTDSDGNEISTQTVETALAPSQSSQITVNYTLPEIITNHTINANVSVAGEINLKNNFANATIGGADIEVKDCMISGNKENAKIKATVTNNSDIIASNVKAKVYKLKETTGESEAEEEIIEIVNIGELSKDENKEIEVDIESSYFDNISDEAFGENVYISASTDTNEQILENNETSVLLEKEKYTPFKLNKDEIELDIGQTSKLEVSYIADEKFDSSSIIYISDDETIATVSSTGNVTAKAEGETDVLVYVGDYYTKCSVKVTDSSSAISSITLDNYAIDLLRGESFNLSATPIPSSYNGKFIWSSDDNNIAIVSSSGKVVAKGLGTTNVTISSENGEVYAICTVKVCRESNAEDTYYIVRYNTNSDDLIPSVELTSGSKIPVPNTLVKSGYEFDGWYSDSDFKNKWDFDNDVITSSVTLYAKWVKKVKLIKLNVTSKNIPIASSYQLKATVLPKDATNKNLLWVSSNSKIASINSSGKITGKAIGTVNITSKAVDGSGIIAKATIKVIPATVKNLKARKTKRQVKLSWSKAKGAKKYEIYRSTKKSRGFKKIKTTTRTSYTMKKAKKTYYYKVRAVNGKYIGGYSKVLRVKK